MNRHALLEIMVEARIQPKSLCYAGSAQYGWNLLFYVHFDNIIEIQTSCATKQRLRAGAASLQGAAAAAAASGPIRGFFSLYSGGELGHA